LDVAHFHILKLEEENEKTKEKKEVKKKRLQAM
jgi:hypothetical protein